MDTSKATTIIGCFLIHLIIGTIYSTGNIMPYIVSYLHLYSSSLTNSSMSILFYICVLSFTFSFHLAAYLTTKFSLKKSIYIGNTIFVSVLFISSFTTNPLAMIIVYGFFLGVGAGISYIPALMISLNCYPNNRGLITGVIICAFGLGSFFFNFVASFTANPNDSKPQTYEVNGGSDKFFDESVAMNVPLMFRVLGFCYMAVTILALFLIKDSELKEENNVKENVSIKSCFKSSPFYQIFFGILFSGTAGLFFVASFKTVGLQLSYDDGFLTIVGSIGSIFNGTSRIFWGILIDKTSFKTTYTCILTFQVILCLTFPLICNINYLFLIWTVIMFACLGGNYTLLPPIAIKLYGKITGVRIYAFFICSMGLASIFVYFIQLYVIKFLGYDYLFLVLSGLSLCPFISNMFFEENISQKDLQEKLV
ncbi:hypothetical protein SteCoe_34419 [Stentor coeruleus]|uniref:Major facilitator superfamily (MFS) profile domain-containing protein n=1 Tax=Stentor coeruleus TaxID=5963 RepID=A0A1R2AUJ3_9CILI|nr:hypothetical protein SteCoe_34419 [Stentor coeruleus]